MAMLLGLSRDWDTLDKEEKETLYAKEREMAEQFRERAGSLVCRDLIAEHPHGDTHNSMKPYCRSLVGLAASIVGAPRAGRRRKGEDMMTSKQRAALRALANGLPAWFQVGKGGVTENMLADVSAALDAHELVKLTVLKTAGISAKEALAVISERLGAEQVAATGNKVVIYRRSTREGVKHIEF